MPLWVWVSGHSAAAPKSPDYREAIQRLEQLLAGELARGAISGVSVALVDDQTLVYANGFGYADKKRRVPARAGTAYRAGSISKLFTAVAAMQLTEQGKLDIDVPVVSLNPAFRIVVPFEDAAPITLRLLMCHRSGMVRESPVGSYFDPEEPTLDQTVASIASCVLVHPPGAKTKYSNVGPSIVGQTVARVAGMPFEDYAEQYLLAPLGMTNSSFVLNKRVKSRLAKGYMPVADGRNGFREIEAPLFELGTLPAGNLYSTAEDLARFVMCLLAEGRAGARQLLKPETLADMWKPQSSEGDGYGLAFGLRTFRGHKAVSHMGAVYGFTSILTAIPKAKVGAIILCNDDIVIGPARKLNAAALDLLLEAKLGDNSPVPAAALQMKPEALGAFAGDFESPHLWASVKAGASNLTVNLSGQRLLLRPVEALKFEGSGRLHQDTPFFFDRETGGRITGFTVMDQKFRRVEPERIAEIPAQWKSLLGSYGPEFIPLIITVKFGHLYAMTENELDNRLTPLNRFVFKMPQGLYTDEQLVFQAGADGKVHTAVLANMPLARRKR